MILASVKRLINSVSKNMQVLTYFPNAQEQNHGKNVILVFKEGMQQMFEKSIQECDYQEDMLILAKAAKTVRHEIFSSSGFNFNGSFPHGCQQQCVPPNLKLMVNMLLRGGDILDQDSTDSQACLTIYILS